MLDDDTLAAAPNFGCAGACANKLFGADFVGLAAWRAGELLATSSKIERVLDFFLLRWFSSSSRCSAPRLVFFANGVAPAFEVRAVDSVRGSRSVTRFRLLGPSSSPARLFVEDLKL